MSENFKQVGSYDNLRRAGGSGSAARDEEEGQRLGRIARIESWMTHNRSKYPDPEELEDMAIEAFPDAPRSEIREITKRLQRYQNKASL